ncbi:hypothetical protein D3C72_2385370 [compost metagenome]
MLSEEALQLVERDQIDAVVEIDVTRALNPDQLLRLGGPIEGVLAKFFRMRLVA